MDPTATLAKILSALDAGDREESIEGLRDLADWLEKGGFPPDIDSAIEDAGFGLE